MNRKFTFFVGLFALFYCSHTSLLRAEQPISKPIITAVRIEGSELVVVAQIPKGLRKATLLTCHEVDGEPWFPVAVLHLDGTGGEAVVRLPKSAELGVLKIESETQDRLPLSFYTGQTKFYGPKQTLDVGVPAEISGDPAAVREWVSQQQLGPITFTRKTDDPVTVSGDGNAKKREVIESDIWSIQSDKLYFFNQLRGLQVVDLEDPKQPRLQDLLELPAAGEQMYVLDNEYIALLGRASCRWSVDGTESQVWIVRNSNNGLIVTSTIPINGSISESRLVGSVLYVASQFYRVNVDDRWEAGTLVTSIRFADPKNPVVGEPIWIPGSGTVVSSTPEYLFVVTASRGARQRSVVNILDLSNEGKGSSLLSSLPVAGRIADKFKIHVYRQTLFVASEVREGSRIYTKLESFSLSDPKRPRRLDSLDLAIGEQLFATRFSEDVGYVVTFLRIDPLWVIDLSNPRDLRVTGELEVPGVSTHIHPVGHRLVAVGFESGRATISLFDVGDPSEPMLLSKVHIGDRFSHTEANYDEKALTVLAEEGLILLPFQSYGEGGSTAKVQLITLQKDRLQEKGTLDHDFRPRRATMFKNRLLSISGTELLIADASDRDAPELVASLTLAWPVDRIFPVGPYLVELSEPVRWPSEQSGQLSVVLARNPHRRLKTLSLGSQNVHGVTLRDEGLYVVQRDEESFVFSVFDLSDLPKISLKGQHKRFTKSVFFGPLDPLWLGDELLVWSSLRSGRFFYEPLPLTRAERLRIPWYTPGGRYLFAYNVSRPSAPRFLSELELKNAKDRIQLSEPLVADRKVYVSLQELEYSPIRPLEEETRDVPRPGLRENAAPNSLFSSTIRFRVTTERRTVLQVIDYAKPAEPQPLKPVEIPNELKGLSHKGSILYTSGVHWDVQGQTDNAVWLDALAYDGVAAHLIDSVELSSSSSLMTVAAPYVFVASSVYEPEEQHHKVNIFVLSDKGELKTLREKDVHSSPRFLRVIEDLVALQLGSEVLLFDRDALPSLIDLGGGLSAGCVGITLSQAAGNKDVGLWVPLHLYGFFHFPVR